MGFHEKSALASLVSLVLVFVPYHWIVYRQPFAFVGLLPLAVVGLVVLLVGFHVVNAVMTRSIRQSGSAPALDELDRLIELRAAKLAGVVLSVVVVTWCLAALFLAPAAGASSLMATLKFGESATIAHLNVSVVHLLVGVHLLFAGFVGANLAYFGAIVFSYRRLGGG